MKGSFIIVSACFLLYLPLATAAPLEEVVINESEPGITIPPEQAAPEPKPKTTVDPETLPISVRSGSAQLDWLAESDRRIIDLNWYVDHLFKKNQVLKRQFEQFEDILKKLHEEEEKLASEMKRWNMGLFFPGMAHVHETIGIKGDFINKVGAKVADCADAFAKDHKKPGVYLIHPVASPYKVHLLCIDGWTVIQRRFDGSENFHRSFDEYLAGFGNFSGEFFVGLENLHRLTFSQAYTLRVDVKSAAGKWYFAVFDSFAITDETDQFRLKLGNMTAGNSDDVMEQSRDKPFSSFDRDNDEWSGGNCAKHFRGGWWSGNCVTNLNQGWCKSGCLRWGSTRVLSSIMRIRPSSSASPDDMTETPDPVAFSLEK